MTMITLSPSRKAKTTPTTTAEQQQQSSSSSSSSSFGFWSLSGSSLHSPTFSYHKKNKAAHPAVSAAPLPAAPTVVVTKKKMKKKVSFQTQCQVRTFEVVALKEEFELSQEVEDEDYWEQLGEDYWYQAKDFQMFKKERRTLVDRIRTIGVARAKGNYCMEGLEYFLTLQAREVHKDRVLDGWVSVLEVQADLEKSEREEEEENDDCRGDCCSSVLLQDRVELIASKYALVSKDCIQDAHKRAMETAQEIQEEDEKLVASIPKSPQPPKKGTVQQQKDNNIKVKALGVWGGTWGSTVTHNSSNNNNNTANSFSTFQKIRPFPRQ